MEKKLKLHEAMEIILLECPDRTSTFKYVSEEIYKRKLYLQKKGTIAPPSQIRLRAKNYEQFEVIRPDKVSLLRKTI